MESHSPVLARASSTLSASDTRLLCAAHAWHSRLRYQGGSPEVQPLHGMEAAGALPTHLVQVMRDAQARLALYSVSDGCLMGLLSHLGIRYTCL